MAKPKSRKKWAPKRVRPLPDLEHAKTAVLNSPNILQRLGNHLDGKRQVNACEL
jgi:hypothetical protein